jgi:hypothetical protein
VVGTRTETCAIAALAKDDFSTDGIHSLYPYLTRARPKLSRARARGVGVGASRRAGASPED